MQLKKKMRKAVNKFVVLLLLLPYALFSQSNDSLQTLSINKKRLRTLAVGSGVAYSLALTGLHHVWYKNTPRQSFHFFNDNAEWKQVDKAGHFYSAFYFGYGFSRVLQGCNVSYTKSNLIGAITGFAVLLPIEIMDGFSQHYGASPGDLLANAAGASFFWSQTLLWNEVRIYPKFSFHRTRFAALRPAVLGDNFITESIKDYNGQTYWLSVDMDKFIQFPKWLNVAVGYGAENMVYARTHENSEAGFSAYRQYYLSLDFDFTAIRTKSKILKTTFFIISLLKVPAPTWEISRKGSQFHFLYF